MSKNPAVAKLTNEKAIAIRKDTRRLKAIAWDYGVSISAISRIKRGETWTHLLKEGAE